MEAEHRRVDWVCGEGLPDFFNSLLAEDSPQVPEKNQQVTFGSELIAKSSGNEV